MEEVKKIVSSPIEAMPLEILPADAVSSDMTMILYVFILACFIGYFVIWKVTPALHTPLMSVTNAISGIVVLGAMTAIGFEGGLSANIWGFMAVFLASVNIFGGFIVTQRMLAMFKKKK